VLRLYVDGVLDTQVALAGSSVDNAGPIWLGHDAWYPGVDAVLDDVRLYDRALTGGEAAVEPAAALSGGMARN
jgi:hypothetical protein